MAFHEAHSPVGAYGVAPQQQARMVDPNTGNVYWLPPVPSMHYPSFRGFGASAPTTTAAQQLAETTKQVGLARAGADLSSWGPAQAPWTMQPVSNEIGAELHIAYLLATASRIADAQGQAGVSQQFYNLAYASLKRASTWIATRMTPQGQLKDAGKVETPQQISKRFLIAASTVSPWVNKIPQLAPVLNALTAYKRPEVIQERQAEVGERPGTRQENAWEDLVKVAVGGAVLLGVAAWAMKRR